MRYLFIFLCSLLSVLGYAQTPTTIANLRALTSATPNQQFYVTNAGREGFFRYDATDNSSVDDNGVIIVSGTGLRFKRLNFQSNYINPATDTVFVTWFGANGADSTFDNTDIFEAIIGRNYKRIHIPDGIYRINRTSLNNVGNSDPKKRGLMVRANQIWTGNGTHRSIVMMDGVTRNTQSTYYMLFNADGGGTGGGAGTDTCDNVQFRGFTIRGKNYAYEDLGTADEAIGIYFQVNASHGTIDSVKFEYIFGHGVADFGNGFLKGGYATVRNCIAQYNAKNGFNMNTPYLTFTGNYGYRNKFSLLEASTGHSIIMNNIAEENDFVGIAIGGYTDSTEANRDGGFNIVAGNIAFGQVSKGISLSGGTSYSLVFNNTTYYNGSQGIIFSEDPAWPGVKTRNNYVFNNIIYDNGRSSTPATSDPHGIFLDAGYSRVYNNDIYSTGSNVAFRGKTYTQRFGVLFSAKEFNMVAGNNVRGHRQNNGDYYIRLGANVVWTDTTWMTSEANNPWIRLSADPFGAPQFQPYSWTQVFGSLLMNGQATSTAYEPTLTGIDPNSTHTLRLAYTGGVDSITLITTRPPTIELGADTTVVNSLADRILTSTASDADGSIASYQWHIMRRPFGSTSTLTNATSATATLTNVAYGQYYIMCEVTDNRGSKGVDYRVINVTQNIPPVASAGNDQTITLPTSAVTLTGLGTDADGVILTYAWTKLTGGSATISSPSSSTTAVTGLAAGTYTFRLLVTDELGATDDDTVQVTVNAAPVNQPPTANAGNDRTITLPTTSVSVTGIGTDPDGTIVSYAWTKISGPVGGNILSPSNATTTITGLQAGTYVYRLTVTDNGLATATDELIITVNAAPPSSNQVVANCTITQANKETTERVYRYSWQAPDRIIYRITQYRCGAWIRERWVNNSWQIIGYQ